MIQNKGCLICSIKLSVVVLQDYLGYVIDVNRTDIVEGTILSIACLYDWIYRVISCIKEIDKRKGHIQKAYSDTYGDMMKIVVEKFTGVVRGFIIYCVPKGLSIIIYACMGTGETIGYNRRTRYRKSPAMRR